VEDFQADHVVIATGARWTCDGIGRKNPRGIMTAEDARVLTPDDVMAGQRPDGPVTIFEGDHFYIGDLVAEVLRKDGQDVTLVIPSAYVSEWSHQTLEQHCIQARLMAMGVKLCLTHNLYKIMADRITVVCGYSGAHTSIPTECVVLVTMRTPVDDLYQTLAAKKLMSLARIGDCLGPSTIAVAIYGDHRYARELGGSGVGNVPFRREIPGLCAVD
jgi:dimethylamine/trimethylamine dehydrogenase